MKKVFLLMCSIAMVACGTIQTVPKSNFKIGYSLYRVQSKCKSVPRIFSGVSYDFCRLHAEPKGSIYNYPLLGFYVTDILIFSPFLDVVVLPITMPQQIMFGNAEVSRRQK